MALSENAAREVVGRMWNDTWRRDMERLNRIDSFLAPAGQTQRIDVNAGRYTGDYQPSPVIPRDAPPIMYELARKSRTNYLPLLVRTFRQALRVDGYLTSAPEEQSPWRWWQRLNMDSRQGAFNDSALKYGSAYELVMPVQAEESMPTTSGLRPTSRGFTPKMMSSEYRDPTSDEWPLYTLHEAGGLLILMDEECEYFFGIEDDNLSPSVVNARHGVLADMSKRLQVAGLSFIEARPHGCGHPPVIRYREECCLDGEECWGIVEPLITIQERIDETMFGRVVAQYFAAFKQRAVLGWVPESESQELKAGASRIWYLDVNPNDVRIEELSETDLTRYIEASSQDKRDFAALGQMPAVDLGVDGISNISDATLAGLERGKNARAGEIAAALGDDYEQSMRWKALISGDVDAAMDYASEVRWADREARTWAGEVDGLVKLVQADILARDTAVAMVPGMSEQQVVAARDDARRQRAAAALTAFGGVGG